MGLLLVEHSLLRVQFASPSSGRAPRVHLLPEEKGILRRAVLPLLPRGEGGPKGRMRVCLHARKLSPEHLRDSATPRCSRTEGPSSPGFPDTRHGHCRDGFRRVQSDWDLPAKLESAETTIAQKAPQTEFAVGRRSAHCSSAGALVRRDACVGLHRSSIGSAALIRRAFGAPPSPQGRRGSCTDVGPSPVPRGKAPFSTPSPSGRRWPEGLDEGGRVNCITTW
jgi:hypothetical protein